MLIFKHSHMINYIALLSLWFATHGCNDFSTFDCFESENGCSPRLETRLEDYAAGGFNDPWIQAGTPVMDMADYRRDLGQALDLGQPTDLNLPADLNPPTDLDLPIDMTLDTDMARFPDLGVTACNPNEVLPPCQSCINGEVQIDDEAGGCEMPNCSRLNAFRRESSPSGLEACIETVYRPREQLCEQGRCLVQLEDRCIGEEQIVATVNLPECVEMTGCIDQQGVSLVPNDGAPCTNNNGTCNATGDCVPNNMMISCPALERSRLCSLSQANTQGCNYQIDLLLGWGWLSFANCNDFCRQYNGQCTTAWNSRPICTQENERSCDQNGGVAICRCTFP